MNLLDKLLQPILLRQLSRGIHSVDSRLAEQNRYLKRLADKFAPELTGVPVDQQIRSVDYSEDLQQARTLEYMEKTLKDLGREPTEEEIVNFLDGAPV